MFSSWFVVWRLQLALRLVGSEMVICKVAFELTWVVSWVSLV
jgi:hypothetical protein